jgi:perosamine synthetase
MYKNINKNKLKEMFVEPRSSIRAAMKAIDKNELGTTIIVDPNTKEFLGLLTDGDLRRALLKNLNLDSKINSFEWPKSVTATEHMSIDQIAEKFNNKIRFIPLLDSKNKVVDIVFYDKRVVLPVSEPILKGKELEYVSECINTGWVSSAGKFVNCFEEMFTDFCEVSNAISTSSGTTALHLALLSLDIGKGDEVIVPSLTFIATANAVKYTGATPIFVDITPETWTIDPSKMEAAITPNTKAIIPVHLYGHPADMDPILKIAKKYKLFVIEDAAEAHGAKYKDKIIGSLGDLATFSFYGNKIITTGEGGMIVTNNNKIAKKIRILRDHGMSRSKRYWHPVLGYNYRLTNIQAAIGVAQMERIESIISSKINIAKLYEDRLKHIKGLTLPPKAKWAKNVYWLYSIIFNEDCKGSLEELIGYLKKRNIDTRPFFTPIHKQPVYNTGQILPVTEHLAASGFSLPSSAGLKLKDVEHVTEAIAYFLS